MLSYTSIINTRDIPFTYTILEKQLPSILIAQCFNDEGLPFSQEVKMTEIGHLFEHIMLEYLCILKLANGHSKATFRGETNWNWKRDLRGTFHIHINAGIKHEEIFDEALTNSIELLVKIMGTSLNLNSYPTNTFTTQSIQPIITSQFKAYSYDIQSPTIRDNR